MKRMRRLIWALGMALALAAVAAGVALATGGGEDGAHTGRHGGGVGLHGSAGASPVAVLSELTGLSIEEIRAELRDGRSLAGIADANGVSADELLTAIVDAKTAAIDALVEAGTLTEEQAAAIKDKLASRVETMIARSGAGHAHGHGGSAAGRFNHGTHPNLSTGPLV